MKQLGAQTCVCRSRGRGQGTDTWTQRAEPGEGGGARGGGAREPSLINIAARLERQSTQVW